MTLWIFSRLSLEFFYNILLSNFTLKLIVLNLLTNELSKGFLIVEKTFEKAHTNCQTRFFTKQNKFIERYVTYNGWIKFKEWMLFRFLKVMTIILTMGASIFDNYSEFIDKA